MPTIMILFLAEALTLGAVWPEYKVEGLRVIPLTLLRKWHVKIEAWMLEQAQINFVPMQEGLKLVK